MMTDTDRISYIKERLSITDVLNMAGIKIGRGGKIFSPGRNERTPSCHIYTKDNRFYDYSTDAKGDQIDMYALIYGLPLDKAIDDLYKVAGGYETRYTPRPERNKVQKELAAFAGETLSAAEKEYYYERLGITGDEATARRDTLKKRLDANSDIFGKLRLFCLSEGWAPGVLSYLRQHRMLNDAAIERFQLFSIKDYAKVQEFLKRKFEQEDLFRSGLINDKGNLIFFKHRLLIPYLHGGAIVYLRGRYFDPEGSGPYPPDGEGNKYFGLRDDGLGVNTVKRFFNTDVIRKMKPGERLTFVEGEFDCMLMDQTGVNCIGIPGSGTVNLDKLTMFRDFDIHLIMDNDKAGGKLMGKIARTFANMGKPVIQKKLPAWAKDVTDFVVGLRANANGQ